MIFQDAIVEFGFDCKVRKLSPRSIDNYQKQLRYLQNCLSEEYHILTVITDHDIITKKQNKGRELVASYKVYYTTLSCSKCGKKLYKAETGSKGIGNPLLICEYCNITSRNPMLDEWYNYPHKVFIFLFPVLLPVLMAVLVPFLMKLFMKSDMDSVSLAVMSFVIGLIIGLCFLIKHLIAIIKSKKRMKNPDHLIKLLMLNIITEQEYKELSEKIQKN